jgi:acetylglutamate kinase
MKVLKISGHEIDQSGFLESLAQAVAQAAEPVIVVHGGGKEIAQMQEKYGVQAQYIDGLRVTDEHSLQITEMVLCGAINTRIVKAFQLAGIEAQGLSGLDRGLIRAQKLEHPKGDLGRVGEVLSVRSEILLDLVQQGVTPVIAPICLGADGAFNVNADHVAGAVGVSVNAEQVIFLTNVKGVLNNQELVPTLTPSIADDLIEQNVIFGGMLPKVRTALHMVEKGARKVVITNLDGLLANSGTAVVGA